jgi:hypothetical protein
MTERVLIQHTMTFADFTRPSDTNAYTAGDVVADSTSAATVLTFPRCAVGRNGTIRSALLIDGAAQATKLSADLFLFDTAPATYGNDNEAFVPTDAEMKTAIGVISLDGTAAANIKVGDATAGAGGNCIVQLSGLDIPFQCVPGSSDLFGVLVARNAYTPVSAETFRIKLGIEQG